MCFHGICIGKDTSINRLQLNYYKSLNLLAFYEGYAYSPLTKELQNYSLQWIYASVLLSI